MINLRAGDRVKFRDGRHALEQGLDKDAVGVVLRTYDLPAHRWLVEVEFPGAAPMEGWHQAAFVPAYPAS
jgi:hypothetical protein